jgi:succinate-semialdehyde dehydrogenase/glutarate-semialdehyde dehydrogenase
MPQRNPQTGEVFKVYESMPDEEVSSIVAASHQAFGTWRRNSLEQRAQSLGLLADALRSRSDEAAALISAEMGKPIPQAKAEVNKCAYLVDWYAENGPALMKDAPAKPLPGFKECFVTFQPLGVILSVMPWNFPFWQAIRMAVPTMLAGNTVVLKHASNCQGSALMIEEIVRSIPALPQDVFRTLVIPARQVDSVLENPFVQGVALTGSTGAGQKVASKAGGLLKKAVVELGGSDGYAILADADLDVAAQAVVDARLVNTGQSCIGPKRIIVDKSVRAEFEEKLVARLAEKKYGTDWGPLVNAAAKAEIGGMIQDTIDQGAKVLAGGLDVAPPEGDCGEAFVAPTILTNVKPGMTAFDEEVFGPVMPVIEADGDEHAIALANQSVFGLGAAVFTKDTEKGRRLARTEVEAGMCFVNDFVRSDPSLPFGGVKTSGLGRECAQFGMMEFVNVKTIALK